MCSRNDIERLVDAVGEALGIDTGTLQEDKFEAACKVAKELMASPEPSPISTDWKMGDRAYFVGEDGRMRTSCVVVGTGRRTTQYKVRDRSGRTWLTHWAYLRRIF